MGAAELSDGMERRTFIQLLGATLALSGLGACSRRPAEKILPYTRQPPDLTPGVPLHFATTLMLSGYGTGLLVTNWDGRPTKVEGNPLHPASLGAAGVFEQASLLQLYDPHRARVLKYRGVPKAWKTFLSQTQRRSQNLAQADKGARLRFLLEPTSSPTVNDLRLRILDRFPNARFYSYDPVGSESAYRGSKLAFGRSLEAIPDFEKANVVLSLESDFLQGTGPALQQVRAFARRRDPGPNMNRLYAVESTLSVTGMMADHRLRLRSSEIAGFVAALAAQLARDQRYAALSNLFAVGAAEPAAPERKRWIRSVAGDLAKNAGRSLVLVGPRQPAEVHAAAYAINAALGNIGGPLRLVAPTVLDLESGPESLGRLANEMKNGAVDTLVITARNPAYTAPVDLSFGDLASSVPNAIYRGLYEDETSARCAWHIPAAHPFESWADARAQDGTQSLVQPMIAPLFNGITEIELLSAFLGEADKSAYQILKEFWQQKAGAVDFERKWEGWLADGIIAGTAAPLERVEVQWGSLSSALRASKQLSQPDPAALEVSFAADYKVHDGRFANNAWLQELPDPVTKLTWDNAALISPTTARDLELQTGDLVELEYRGSQVSAPVLVLPGHVDGAVTLPLGYGRDGSESVARGVGFNASLLRRSHAPWFDSGLKLKKSGGRYPLSITQAHWSMEGRDLAMEATLADFQRDKLGLDHLRGTPESLYTPVDYQQQPFKWAMALDLNRCTGCSACVVACQSENNIPVVGKEQVGRSREMHWLRIDRYFTGPLENPTAITQPVACVHCEKAPCEYVCPVNATVHSDEGLNEMVYNRCIGTRYCSNNCPYKVRRFNFLHYTQNKTPTEKMAMNPDVTVRARGVMEKCSYCVQRIERARIQSRIEGRPLQDGELMTACQQACPAEAISFGSLHDTNSRVSELHRDARRYDLLQDLGTRPRTAYLARIKNPNPELGRLDG
jgi:molybdopterin-containing oxidoreductase family iron-sulfur binding subunit